MEHKYVWIEVERDTGFHLEGTNYINGQHLYLKRVLIPQFTEEQIKDLSPRDAGFYKLGFEAAINSISLKVEGDDLVSSSNGSKTEPVSTRPSSFGNTDDQGGRL